MTDAETELVSSHFSRANRVAEYLDSPNPMNEARRDLVRRMVLLSVPPGSEVLEIGCGIGTLTAELAAAGMACTALDLSAEMIRRAKKLLGGAAKIERGDLFDFMPSRRFAAVIANGVAPYYRDTHHFLRRIADLIEPGGIAAIVHRNALFNLFALNRGTVDFVADRLLEELPAPLRRHIAAAMTAIPGLAEPPHESSSSEIHRGSENPLIIADLYRVAGLKVREIRYCFIHGAPPRLALIDGMPDAVDLQHRYEQRWEGMFLGSQFLVLAAHC